MTKELSVLDAQETINIIDKYFIMNGQFVADLDKAVRKNGLDNISKADLFSMLLTVSQIAHVTLSKIEPDVTKLVDFYTKYKPLVRP